jgi:hypothetical protein
LSSQDNLPAFQQYQLEFAAYLRDPSTPKPAGLPEERIAVYEEIVFNNLLASVSACFPIAKAIAGVDSWRALVRSFMQQHSADSPIFRQVPAEFLDYMAHANTDVLHALPPYFLSLCHYEWVELAVVTAADLTQPSEIDARNKLNVDLLNAYLVFAPGMQLLHYDYAVHHISPDNRSDAARDTYLVVYRDVLDEVKFIELNAITHQLLTLLQQPMAAKQALAEIAVALGYADAAMLEGFGLEVLQDLLEQGLIRGTRTN